DGGSDDPVPMVPAEQDRVARDAVVTRPRQRRGEVGCRDGTAGDDPLDDVRADVGQVDEVDHRGTRRGSLRKVCEPRTQRRGKSLRPVRVDDRGDPAPSSTSAPGLEALPRGLCLGAEHGEDGVAPGIEECLARGFHETSAVGPGQQRLRLTHPAPRAGGQHYPRYSTHPRLVEFALCWCTSYPSFARFPPRTKTS